MDASPVNKKPMANELRQDWKVGHPAERERERGILGLSQAWERRQDAE